MSIYEFALPSMGEGIIEATITRWFVKKGDYVHEDEPLLEVATDKVDSEIPSPVSGKITRIIYHEGEIPKIGEVLAIIEINRQAQKTDHVIDKRYNALKPEHLVVNTVPDGTKNKTLINTSNKTLSAEAADTTCKELYLTPLVRFLARQRGISVDELEQIKGSGAKGRLTKVDLNTYIQSGRSFRNLSDDGSVSAETQKEPLTLDRSTGYIPGPGEEVIEMDRTRKLIAEHMVRSKRTSPHVTSMVEVDVTPLVQWRQKNKDRFYKTFGIKLTYTPVIIEASVKALKEFPDINISVAGNRIIKKNYFNIGVATALPNGNLIVPVIKEADKDNLISIAQKLADLADRARKGKLLPAEIKGGTFTITNMGQYDNISGTPIINQPEVAILAVGAIKKKPAVVYVGNQPVIGIRDILVLSLTYDHRVVDGALGGSFLRTIGRYLEMELPVF